MSPATDPCWVSPSCSQHVPSPSVSPIAKSHRFSSLLHHGMLRKFPKQHRKNRLKMTQRTQFCASGLNFFLGLCHAMVALNLRLSPGLGTNLLAEVPKSHDLAAAALTVPVTVGFRQITLYIYNYNNCKWVDIYIYIYNHIILYIVKVFILNRTITGGREANLGNKLMEYDGMVVSNH